MNRRIFTLILSLGIAALFAPGLALAEDHLAEAISHTAKDCGARADNGSRST